MTLPSEAKPASGQADLVSVSYVMSIDADGHVKSIRQLDGLPMPELDAELKRIRVTPAKRPTTYYVDLSFRRQ